MKLYFSKRKCGCPRFHLLLTHPRDENKREEVSQFNFGFRFCFAFIVSADFGSLSNFSATPMVKLIVFYRKSIIITKSRDNFLFELNISTSIPQHFIAEVFPVSVALIFKTFKLDTLVICMGAMICCSVFSLPRSNLFRYVFLLTRNWQSPIKRRDFLFFCVRTLIKWLMSKFNLYILLSHSILIMCSFQSPFLLIT